MRYVDADFPADPYPGLRPPASYVHVDGVGHRLHVVPPPKGCITLRAPSGYVLADGLQDLDVWLAARGAAALAGRTPVLAYGSNACPAKLTWLRQNLGLAGPMPVLLADCTDVAAVWANGARTRDGIRPVVLVAAPGVIEQHAVLLADDDQLAVLDRCEGVNADPQRYRRELLAMGTVTVAGQPVEGLQYYRGVRADRMPMLAGGAPVRAFDPGARSLPATSPADR